MKFIIKSVPRHLKEATRYFLGPGMGTTYEKDRAFVYNSDDPKHAQRATDYTKHGKNFVIVPVVRP